MSRTNCWAICLGFPAGFIFEEGFRQCLSQYLETGCLKLAVVKCLGVQIFKGDHNILIFEP